MSKLQAAMATLIGVFHEHAAKEGKEDTLSRSEFKTLLKTEFGGMLGNTYDKIFQDLDQDGSGDVCFTEFVTMVAGLTAATNEMMMSK